VAFPGGVSNRVDSVANIATLVGMSITGLDDDGSDFYLDDGYTSNAIESVPEEFDDTPDTEPVKVHTVKCPMCGEKLVTMALIEGGHTCRSGS